MIAAEKMMISHQPQPEVLIVGSVDCWIERNDAVRSYTTPHIAQNSEP